MICASDGATMGVCGAGMAGTGGTPTPMGGDVGAVTGMFTGGGPGGGCRPIMNDCLPRLGIIYLPSNW